MSSASTLARADRACAQLRRDGKPVTFTAVAAITGLGRTTLYRNPALRAIIDDHRRRADRSAISPASPTRSRCCTPPSTHSPSASAGTKSNPQASP